MMTGVVMAAMLSAPVIPAFDERSLFSFPDAEDFRLQVIERLPGETGWPFVPDRGYLLCVFMFGQRTVYFATMPEPGDDPDDFEPRVIIVSNNPVDLIFANLANRDLVREQADPAALVRAFAPVFAAGKRLCDQPRGEVLGPGEL